MQSSMLFSFKSTVMNPSARYVLLCVSFAFLHQAMAAEPGVMVAPKPPMGWNSFDCYDSRITEVQFKANVDFMARELKEIRVAVCRDRLPVVQPGARKLVKPRSPAGPGQCENQR